MNHKYEYDIIQNSITEHFVADKVAYKYPQTDGDGAGATVENIMYLDPLEERMTFIAKYERPDEITVSKLLKLVKNRTATVKFFDIREQQTVEKVCYLVLEDINCEYCLDKNGEEEFVCEPFELQCIQQIPDVYVSS